MSSETERRKGGREVGEYTIVRVIIKKKYFFSLFKHFKKFLAYNFVNSFHLWRGGLRVGDNNFIN